MSNSQAEASDLRDLTPSVTWPKAPAGIAFESIQADHSESLNDLFQKVFKLNRQLAHYQWKFWENPAGPPIGMLARDEASGKALSANIGVRKNVRILGEQRQALQICESATDPEARGGGRYYRPITNGTALLAAQDGILFAYGGQSSDAAIKIGQRWFWYRVIFALKMYECRLSLGPALQKRLGVKLGGLLANASDRIIRWARDTDQSGREITAHGGVTSDFETIWQENKDRYALIFDRSTATLKWRYEHCPLYRHHFLVCKEKGIPKGYLIWREWQPGNSKLATVLDLMDGQNTAVARSLLQAVKFHAAEQACDFIHYGAFPDSSGEQAAQTVNGFAESKRLQPDRVIATPMPIESLKRTDIEQLRVCTDGSQWYYTQGDCDFLD